MVSLVRWYAYRIESLHVFVYLTYGWSTLCNHMDIGSGHLVIYLDIYDSSGVKTLSPLAMSSPRLQMSKSSCHVIWSVALQRPEQLMEAHQVGSLQLI